MKFLSVSLCLIAFNASAISLNAYQVDIDKMRYIQKQAGMDNTLTGAYNQVDLVFYQVCKQKAAINDIRRIANTNEFYTLIKQLRTGQSFGISQSEKILVTDKNQFCRGK
jgi:hypothetical protein